LVLEYRALIGSRVGRQLQVKFDFGLVTVFSIEIGYKLRPLYPTKRSHTAVSMCWSLTSAAVAGSIGFCSGCHIWYRNDARMGMFVMAVSLIQVCDLLLWVDEREVGLHTCSGRNAVATRAILGCFFLQFATMCRSLQHLVVSYVTAGVLFVLVKPGAVVLTTTACTTLTIDGYLNWWGNSAVLPCIVVWWLPMLVSLLPSSTPERLLCFGLGALVTVVTAAAFPPEAFGELFCCLSVLASPFIAVGYEYYPQKRRVDAKQS